MNASGLASLISGMQQGYSFSDDLRRKQAQDDQLATDNAFKAEQRGQQRKEWSKTNSYDDEVKQLTDSYYPQQQKGPAAAPNVPAAAGTTVPAGPPPAIDTSMEGSPAAAASGGSAIPAQAGTAMPARPQDPMANTNNTLDFAIKRAMIDVKHGKMDGAGLLTMQKMVDGMKAEHADTAIMLMNQGRYDEALAAFNATGEHRGQLVDAKDGVFEANGVKVPTKIVTIQDGDGSTRTINTAQTLYQRQSMDKIIQQTQSGQQQAEAARHNVASEKSTDMHYKAIQSAQAAANVIAQGNLKLAQARDTREAGLLKKDTLEGQITQLEAVVGPMSPEEKKVFARQLIGGTRGGAGKNMDEAFVNDLTKKWSENNPAAAPAEVAKFRAGLVQSFHVIGNNGPVEEAVHADFGKQTPDSPGYAAVYAKAKGKMNMSDAQLSALGYPLPNGAKTPVAARGTMVPNPLAPSTVAPTWKSPSEQANAQASAGFDAALTQTAQAIAAANKAGDAGEVKRLTELFQQQSAAKNASLGGGQ